jgi:hypothetical protein
MFSVSLRGAFSTKLIVSYKASNIVTYLRLVLFSYYNFVCLFLA